MGELRKYYNLSGLAGRLDEWYGGFYIYLRSSHVESGAWEHLFWSLPADMLYRLGRVEECHVYERSENSPGKIVRVAIPVIRFVLSELWSGGEPEPKTLRDSCTQGWRAIQASRPLRRHLRYFGKDFPPGHMIPLTASRLD